MENCFIKHMGNAKAVKTLNQSNPQPRPHRDPFSARFSWQCQLLLPKTGSDELFTRTTILSGEAHSCKLQLENLKPIHLCDMKVRMVHHGRYLVCQASVMPLPIIGVNTLIEDLNGDVEELSLYNFSYKLDNLEWLKPGTILIIKEPWLRYGSHGKTPSIRIDSPSDVIFIDPTDFELLKKIGATQWHVAMSKDTVVIQKMANDCFTKEDFNGALMLYDRALRYNPEPAVLYLNKSLICLRTGAFYLAYNVAKLALDKGGDPEKAIYRMGMAAYGMHQWEKAAIHFADVCKKFPCNTSANDQLKRAMARCNEQITGNFDFKSMYLESKKEKPDIDVSDYIGPIEISNISGKGRGIIASKDIQRGTLLAVSKAFASGYSKDYPGIVTAINLIRNESDGAAEMLQVIRAIENLQKNPQRSKEVYDLYAGDSRKEEIPEGIIDAALIQQISSLNRFASDKIGSDDCHLFILPSYFNHSCIANAYRSFYGDVMVIHAATNIKKGDEIFLSYISPLKEFSERTTKLTGWKFACQCKLCKSDAKDPNCKKRSQILEEFSQYARTNKNVPKNVIDKGEKLLEKMRQSYGNRNDFKINLIQMLNLLAPMYYIMGNVTKSIKYLEEIIILMGDELLYVFDIAETTLSLAHSYFSNGDFFKGQEAIRKAFVLSLCTDMEHFEMLYPEMAKTMKGLNLR